MKKHIFLIWSVLFILFVVAYKIGRTNGFNQGWDKGYIRGLENSQNYRECEQYERYKNHAKALGVRMRKIASPSNSGEK